MSASKDDYEILYNNPIPRIVSLWDSILPPCRLLDLLTVYDIANLNKIAKSGRVSDPTKKKKLITSIMEARGFRRINCGTNRIVFKYKEDQRFLVKVAFDQVAISDNLAEMRNQEYLKPFCAKCFEVSPCGTVGMFERVVPVLNKDQFISIGERVFDIIVNCFIGKFIMADFGNRYYRNWGVRKGAHPVILDYPYLYELDPTKLTCTKYDPKSPTKQCGGVIDYDDGFNYLICPKCGKMYLASDLAKKTKKKSNLMVESEEVNMKIQLTMRDGSVRNINGNTETAIYKKKETRGEYRTRKNLEHLKVHIRLGDHSEIKEKEEKERKEAEQKKQQEAAKIVQPKIFKTMGETEKPISVTIEGRDGNTYITKENGLPKYSEYNDPTYRLFGAGASKVEEPQSKSSQKIYREDYLSHNADNDLAEYQKPVEAEEYHKDTNIEEDIARPISETVEPQDIVEVSSENNKDRSEEDDSTPITVKINKGDKECADEIASGKTEDSEVKEIDVSVLQNKMNSNTVQDVRHENRNYSSYSSSDKSKTNEDDDKLFDEF